MATNFPTSLDTLTNPTSSDSLSSPSHASQHANVNDAVEALQAKVGVNGSAVTTSLDYKVANQGLVFIKTQTITGNPATQAITNVFDANEFTNYRIVINNIYTSTGTGLLMTMGATTTGYYGGSKFYIYDGTEAFVGRNGQGNWFLLDTTAAAGNTCLTLDVYQPNNATRTMLTGTGVSDGIIFSIAGMLAGGTAYTDFTLALNTGGATFTGGTVTIYGYRK
jgi:hypothetical protein